MSILPTVILPIEKNQQYAKIPSNYRKTQQKHKVENFVKKYCSFFYPPIEKFKREKCEKMHLKSIFRVSY